MKRIYAEMNGFVTHDDDDDVSLFEYQIDSTSNEDDAYHYGIHTESLYDMKKKRKFSTEKFRCTLCKIDTCTHCRSHAKIKALGDYVDIPTKLTSVQKAEMKQARDERHVDLAVQRKNDRFNAVCIDAKVLPSSVRMFGGDFADKMVKIESRHMAKLAKKRKAEKKMKKMKKRTEKLKKLAKKLEYVAADVKSIILSIMDESDGSDDNDSLPSYQDVLGEKMESKLITFPGFKLF